MKILICGAGGQLGRVLARELSEHQLISATREEGLDIRDLAAIRKLLDVERPDLVINCAAFTQVDLAETEITAAYEVNALGPRNLAIATAAADIALFHVSTDYVFDGKKTQPYHEFDATNPRTVYGSSKLAGEEAIRTHNPRHYIARTAWLYDAEGNNFPKTMLSFASRDEVSVVSDQYGSPTYCPHLARAMHQLLDTAAYGTYHFAGEGATSWFELTQRLYHLAGIETRVLPVATSAYPRPAERPRYSVLTTLQRPRILLPSWEIGISEFTAAWKQAEAAS